LPIKLPISTERLRLLIVNLVASVVISILLKKLITILRPCQLNPNLYSVCLPDFAYPSQHASTAFSFIFPFLGHALFPLTYVIGLLVGWSQVYQGLHSWLDIGGGIAVAGLGYGTAEMLVIKQKNIIYRTDERSRQAIHASIGLLLCLMIWLSGIETTSYFVLLGTCVGILIIHLTLMGIKLPGIDKLLERLERTGVIPGEGSMYYALGVLFALGLLRENSAAAISVILVLALGDSLATYVGKYYGKHKLPWNKNKTIEGSMGFAAGALSALLILPVPATILVVLLATAVESLPIRLDDNITVPFATSLLYYFYL
jgi:dolichol kinase